MKSDYEALLKKARSELPEKVFEQKRFVIPEPELDIEGNKTILRNFKDISQAISRDSNHLMKFLLREFGTSGNIEGVRAVFQGKFFPDVVREKINRYINEFVFCLECKKPDTHIEKKGRQNILRCDACGARHPVRSL